MTNYIECELYLVSNPNQTMHSRSSFDLVVRSIDGKLAVRSEIICCQSCLRRDYNAPRYAEQSEIAAYL